MTERTGLSPALQAARAVMLALIVVYGGNMAFELGASVQGLRDGGLGSPFDAALALGGGALAWWAWTLHRRLGRRDRLARTQATAVHAIAVVIACAGAILVAVGVVRRWRSTRSVGVLLAAIFALTAPLIDQLVFGGIESSFRHGAKAAWNGELAFFVSAVNVTLMVLLTRPAARGWELTRERAVHVVPGGIAAIEDAAAARS